MSWVAVSKELSGMVAKRKLGAGEFVFVSLASGREVSGKAEALELMQRENSWQRLHSLKTAKETEAQFAKTVKKRLDYVTVVTEPVVPTNPPESEEETEPEPELVDLDDSDDDGDVTLPTKVNASNTKDVSSLNVSDNLDETLPTDTHSNGRNSKDEKDSQNIQSSDIEENSTDFPEPATSVVSSDAGKSISKPTSDDTTNGDDKTNINEESKTEKRKKKPKAGPRSKVARTKSPSPEPTISLSRVVGCSGFPPNLSPESLAEYLRDNHRGVLKTVPWCTGEGEVLVVFEEVEAARLFSTLHYILYKGKSISVFSAETALSLASEEEQTRVNRELAN